MRAKQTFSTGIAAILALSPPVAVYAQAQASAATDMTVTETGAPQSQEDAMLAMITKMFDTPENSAPIDPAQLKLGEAAAAKLLPAGSLKTMMNKMIDMMMTPIMNAFPEMSSGEIMMKTGIYEGEIENLNEETRKTITAMLDPTRKERGKQMVTVMEPLLNETMAMLEPPMRTGISRAYARKFSAAQLRAINGFFATPTGAVFAAESYPMQADPEVMRAIVKAVPELMKTLKTKGPGLETEFKKLPKERALADLNKDEMASLAALLKVDVAKLEEQREAMANSGAEAMLEAGDVAAAAADAAAATTQYADETGTEPWYEEDNWAKADRTRATAAFKKREKAEAASTAAYGIWAAAFDKAVAASRTKYQAAGWKPDPAAAGAAEAATEAAAAAEAATDAAAETP
jgi:hypothetical protein